LRCKLFLRLCQASLHAIQAAGKYPNIKARIQRVLANFYQLRAELLNLTGVTASPQGGHQAVLTFLNIITQM
jgi:hypothetical protein